MYSPWPVDDDYFWEGSKDQSPGCEPSVCIFAQVSAEWSVTSGILSPSMKGWKCMRLSFAAKASLSVAEYLVSVEASTLLQ